MAATNPPINNGPTHPNTNGQQQQHQQQPQQSAIAAATQHDIFRAIFAHDDALLNGILESLLSGGAHHATAASSITPPPPPAATAASAQPPAASSPPPTSSPPPPSPVPSALLVNLYERSSLNGMAPLHYAAMCGNPFAVERLLRVFEDEVGRVFAEVSPTVGEGGGGTSSTAATTTSSNGGSAGPAAQVEAAANANLPFSEICGGLGGLDAIDFVNYLTADRQTALHLAASRNTQGHYDVLRILLKVHDGEVVCRANVNYRSTSGFSALHIAAACGNAEGVRLLLEAGADAKGVTAKNLTALHAACDEGGGNVEVIRLLIHKGQCDVNAWNMEGARRPLHIAAVKGHVEAVRVLVEEGYADVNARDWLGRCALHMVSAQVRSADRVAIVKLLTDRRRHTISASGAGSTLSVDTVNGKEEADEGNEGAEKERYEDAEEEPLPPITEGHDRFHDAIPNPITNTASTKTFVPSYTNINAITKRHKTALHDAAIGDDVVFVQSLLDRGACLDALIGYWEGGEEGGSGVGGGGGGADSSSSAPAATYVKHQYYSPFTSVAVLQALLDAGLDPDALTIHDRQLSHFPDAMAVLMGERSGEFQKKKQVQQSKSNSTTTNPEDDSDYEDALSRHESIWLF